MNDQLRSQSSREEDAIIRFPADSARPIVIGAQASPIIDELGATIQRAFQVLVSGMSAAEIIDEAMRLDSQLRDPLTRMGPLEKSAVAETLLKLRDRMDEMLQKASGRRLGLPSVPGVVWKPGDPLAGIVEGISPFHMHEWWQTYLKKPAPAKPRSRETQSRRRTPSPTPSSKKPSTPAPPPRKLPPTFDEAIKRARRALQSGIKVPDLGPTSRMLCVINKVAQPGANAWFISEPGIRHLQNYENGLNQSRIRMITAGTLPPSEQAKLDKFDEDWRNEKDSGNTLTRQAYVIKLARHLTTPMFDDYWKKGNSLWSSDARQYLKWIAAKRHNDDLSILMGLRQLNMKIMSAFSFFHKQSGKYVLGGGSSMDISVRRVKNRISALQNNSRAVLGCYK